MGTCSRQRAEQIMSSGVIPGPAATSPFGPFASAVSYAIDTAQRTAMFWDVMRERGNQYREHLAETAPHGPGLGGEVVLGGWTFGWSVNYALARIVPPTGVEI